MTAPASKEHNENMIESCSLPTAAAPPPADPVGARPVLPGGGIMPGRLHEVFATEPVDAMSAMGFTIIMALSVLPPGTPLLWLRLAKAEREAALYGPGLAALGMDPARVILGRLPDALAVLRAGVDAIRCSGTGAVIMDLPGRVRELDLTATRRMTLAAEASGVTPILLRTNATASASSAHSRWSVRCMPSRALPANAPGHTGFSVTIVRRRDGPAGLSWDMEWDRDTAALRPITPDQRDRAASFSGAALPLAVGGPLVAGAGGVGRARRA